MKWLNMISLVVLLVGGLNFLLMGLFKFDMFASIFGGTDAVTSRVFYSLFGIGAVVLLVTILYRAFSDRNEKAAERVTEKSAEKKTA